jgi:hypothetical protein
MKNIRTITAAMVAAIAAASVDISREPQRREDPRIVAARKGLITHKYPNRKQRRTRLATLRVGQYIEARRLNKRLRPATGPGSINVESEMRQLIDAGQEAAAYQLFIGHGQVVCIGRGDAHCRLKPWCYRWAKQYRERA